MPKANTKSRPRVRKNKRSATGRERVTPQWWTKANAIVRVTLKPVGDWPVFPIDPAKASPLLDAMRAKGVSAIEIFAPQFGGTAYHGLDPIDNYRPTVGTMDDFRALVKLIHSKRMAVVVFINIGYTSLEAPEWLKACDDVKAGRTSVQTRRFRWADRPDAPEPNGDSIFLLADPQRVWRYGNPPGTTPPERYLSLDWAGRGNWEYAQRAGKYYWTKWGQVIDGKRIGVPHYDWADPGWQKEAERILRHWMETGLDGVIMDAPGMYIDCDWAMTRRRITGPIASYGNTYMQPEGGGSLYEDPEAWISEGGYNSMQDYPMLQLEGTGSASPILRAVEQGDPRAIEPTLRSYHDRIVDEGGVLYLTGGRRLKASDPRKQELAWEIGVLVGDVLSLSYDHVAQITPRLTRLFELKQKHPALQNLSRRRPIHTTAPDKHYAFLRTAADKSQRILVALNVQPTEQTLDMDLSGVASAGLIDLFDNTHLARTSYFKASVPPLSYRLFLVKRP